MSTTPARVGVFGGTFDPIHVGHLAAASEVFAAMTLDLLLVVPADVQPFKDADAVTPAQHRLAMVRLAVEDDPRFEVSDVDIVRGAPTYTVDTLTDLARLYRGSHLTFITGADALATLDTWRDAERLRELAAFVGVTRPGYSLPPRADDVRFVEVPAMQVSSTDVRRRVGSGQPIRYLVPSPVVDYIAEHELYLGGSDG